MIEHEEACEECGETFITKLDDPSDPIENYCSECGKVLCPQCMKKHNYDDCAQTFLEQALDKDD